MQVSKKQRRMRRIGLSTAERQRAMKANQVWSWDFVEDQTENGSRFRILTLIDEHTRRCLATHVAWSIRAVDVITVVEAAMERYGVPEHLRGTYLGLASDPIIDHLVGLGVTAVELMPVHHFIDDGHLVDRGSHREVDQPAGMPRRPRPGRLERVPGKRRQPGGQGQCSTSCGGSAAISGWSLLILPVLAAPPGEPRSSKNSTFAL